MTDIRSLLSNNIKKRREFLGISQAALAEGVETSTHYISQIERKIKFPSPEMLERIAVALEFDTPELFSVAPFPPEALKEFQEGVKADISSIESRLENLMWSKK
ncbi:MAG: helix-turn-helix domain-containing protein [Treponema sp.]|jgi:transcriptional regulator with XRE-family HTH domain|nr:helix-turn-helix domain-containing protein [Treponema sp.]